MREQRTEPRKCSTCEDFLPLGGSPRRLYCDSCKKRMAVERVAVWRKENPEKARELRDKEYAENAEVIKARSKQWYLDNTDQAKASSKEWREANPEKMRGYWADWFSKPGNAAKAKAWVSAWMRAHPEKIKAYWKKWYIENQDTLRRLASHRAQTYAASDFTFEDWIAILEVFGHQCAYCLCSDKKLTMDHVLPLSKGGTHTADNIVPACKSCNSRKNNRPLFVMLTKPLRRNVNGQAL